MKEYQSLLFPYAYNILGSAEDAKDAIQDVVLKYTSKGVQPDNEKNYLIKGVINQSINLKQKKQRSQPKDEWLPEPIATETSDLGIELRELVSYSLLFLLERLNAKERAVFILKEAFAYTHEETAEVLSITVQNSRQLLSRAHQKVKQDEIAKPTNQHFQSIDEFVSAIEQKDLEALHNLFADDISFYADGGNKVKVVQKHCRGINEVADLLIMVHHKYQTNFTAKPLFINHQPALLYSYKDKTVLTQIFEFDLDQKIKQISIVLDPLKLRSLESN